MIQKPEWYRNKIREAKKELSKNPKYPNFIRDRIKEYQELLLKAENNGQMRLNAD